MEAASITSVLVILGIGLAIIAIDLLGIAVVQAIDFLREKFANKRNK